MDNKIHGLRHVLVNDKDSESKPEKRSIFEYVILDLDEFITLDAEGHCTLDEAFEIAKDKFTDIIMKYGLNEAIDIINITHDELKLFNVNKKEDLQELVFDKDVLDNTSILYLNFKKIIMNHWDYQLEEIYYICNYAKNALIHDDTDKKTLEKHYFDSLIEFNDKVSFLDYFNSYVVPEMLIPNRYYLQLCHKYFYLKPDYYIIDDTITRSELQEFLNKSNISLDIGLFRHSVIWAAFGYYFGITHGLTDIESKCFASILNKEFSSFRSEDLKLGVEDNFKLDLIEKIISQVGLGEHTPEEETKIIFFSLFDLFKNRIRDFEYKNKRLEFRVSQNQYDKFMALEGKSKADKLDNLMRSDEVVDGSKLPNINFNEKNINDWADKENKKFIDEIIEDVTETLKQTNYSEIVYKQLHGVSKKIIEINYEEGYLSPNMKMINEELASMTPEDWEFEERMEKQMEEQERMMKELEEEFANKTPEDWEFEERMEKQMEEQEHMMKELEEMARLDAEIEKLKQEKKKRLENK